jgi:hypothetical protein
MELFKDEPFANKGTTNNTVMNRHIKRPGRILANLFTKKLTALASFIRL